MSNTTRPGFASRLYLEVPPSRSRWAAALTQTQLCEEGLNMKAKRQNRATLDSLLYWIESWGTSAQYHPLFSAGDEIASLLGVDRIADIHQAFDMN